MRQERPSDLLDPDALLRRSGARLLVLAPHPDDESLAAGGLIQRALRYGVPVGVAYVTDGENNPWPQRALEQRWWIGAQQRAAWGTRRRAEADTALQVLGVDPTHVYRLGWPDGGVTWKLLDDAPGCLAALRDVLEREQPTVLVLPDLVDRHPDHSAVHVLTEMLFQTTPQLAKPECLGYLLHGRSRPGVPRRAVLTLTGDEAVRKRAAIGAHASQMALSGRRLLRAAKDSEAFVAGLDCHDRGVATLPWCPPRGLRRALALLVVDAHGGQRLRVGGAGANLFWRDGTPAAGAEWVPQPPCYIKLYCPLPSPWVFDGWGWCRFGA